MTSIISPSTSMAGYKSSTEFMDACDQYLFEIGFYRKRITADASSVFRVVSKYIYETEIHHQKVRDSCISYMANNRGSFEMVIHSLCT